MFSDLKNLYIDESFVSLIKNSSFMLNYPLGSSYSILVQFLNELRLLETLEIGAELGFNCHQATIRLDQLKYLKLGSATTENFENINHFRELRDLLIDPKSIKTLEMDYGVTNTEVGFKNQIAHLTINNISCEKPENYQIFLEFKSLRVLHLVGLESNISFNYLINLVHCLPKFHRLVLNSPGGFKAENLQRLTHSRRLKENKNLEIFVNGILLSSLSELIDGFNEDEILLEENGLFSYLDVFQIKPDSILDSNPGCCKQLTYSEVEEMLPYSVPFYDPSLKKMIKSLISLSHLRVDREIDSQHRFLEFLKYLNACQIRIRELVLINSYLDKNFYTYYLNYNCPYLKILEIKGGANTITNFNFLLNLEHLQILQIKCQLDFFFIDKLFKRLKRLKKISFIFDSDWMFIERKNPEHYYYSPYDGSKIDSVNFKYGFGNGSKIYNTTEISEIDFRLLSKPTSNKIKSFLNRLL